MLAMNTTPQPPYSNTGARPAAPSWGVDWFEYTCPDGTPFHVACPWIPFESWEDVGHGWKFYTHSAKAGSAMIAYGGAEGQGVHVTLSATALRECVGMWGLESPLAAIKACWELGFRASRLDWAGDIYNEGDFFDFVQEHLDGEQATMRWKDYRPIQRFGLGRKPKGGRTIEFGQRVSDTFARLYDKKAERIAKRADIVEELGFMPDDWVRFEVVFRRAHARRLHELIFWEDWETIQEIMLGLLDLKDRNDNDRTKTRWKTAQRWADFVSARVSRTIGLPAVFRGAERAQRWIEKGVAAILASLQAGLPGADAWFADALALGRTHWRKRHYALIAAARLGPFHDLRTPEYA